MEHIWNWEQGTLVNELIRGMESAEQLRLHLDTASSAESRDLLVQKILSSYDKTLLILKFNGPLSMDQHQPQQSPLSIDGGSRRDDLDKGNQDTRDVSQKRNMLPSSTGKVRITSGSLLEGTHDDGNSWRKYGQKDIMGAKYPRSYYRCTCRHTQDCWATKQVQRSEEDPTIFEVTYRGAHTCAQGNQAVPPPATPESQQHKLTNLNNNNNQLLQSQDILLSLRNCLRVNTEGLDNRQMAPFSFPSTPFELLKSENHSFSPSGILDNNILNNFSSPFMSPATPELNYFSAPQSSVINFGGILNTHNFESDPIMDLDFTLDQVEFDPNFQFDTLDFSTNSFSQSK